MCSISFSHELRITSINYRCDNILDRQDRDCDGEERMDVDADIGIILSPNLWQQLIDVRGGGGKNEKP